MGCRGRRVFPSPSLLFLLVGCAVQLHELEALTALTGNRGELTGLW